MNKTTFTPDKNGKSMVIERMFEAPLKKVWEAFTTQKILDRWWAPAPWKVETKEFDFREGGRWLYAMVGPKGEKHYSLEEFEKIETMKSFSAKDFFCNEEGKPLPNMPQNRWKDEFVEKEGKTYLRVTLQLSSAEDLEKLTEMGFKEGFSMGLDQLERLLS